MSYIGVDNCHTAKERVRIRTVKGELIGGYYENFKERCAEMV
ncbi:hypothetical protein ACFHWD_01440 [Clostridium sp. MT-14]|jgi:hypothetical protein|uniref:Uncharacterized protein n=1 Tax=Clostridium luticellarii TaxID=1691940 RepID=A0A2T0BPX5_9CLOT|nr:MULTISPECIES: hypothetical protein [Clostridium]PRR85920.1 hypothetical protein CLLU_11240 [Clostridium luticellarii]